MSEAVKVFLKKQAQSKTKTKVELLDQTKHTQ
jgi:hypothetical protein